MARACKRAHHQDREISKRGANTPAHKVPRPSNHPHVQPVAHATWAGIAIQRPPDLQTSIDPGTCEGSHSLASLAYHRWAQPPRCFFPPPPPPPFFFFFFPNCWC